MAHCRARQIVVVAALAATALLVPARPAGGLCGYAELDGEDVWVMVAECRPPNCDGPEVGPVPFEGFVVWIYLCADL